MTTRLLFCFILLCSATAGFATEPVSLKKCMEKGIVSVQACSRGGYMGKGLELNLVNRTAKDIVLQVDPALIFTPEDAKYQHLVAVGQEEVLVPAGKAKLVSIQTFCGKAPASSPKQGVTYRFWKQGNADMVAISKYIGEHSLFGSMGQHAIWIFTDKHSLNSVSYFCRDAKAGTDFLQYLCRVLKKEMPQYHTIHKIDTRAGAERVYNAVPEKVYTDIFWTKKMSRNVHVLVYDSTGKLYKEIRSGEIINSAGEHLVRVTFDPAKDHSGTYTVQLKDDENVVWVEKKVEVG